MCSSDETLDPVLVSMYGTLTGGGSGCPHNRGDGDTTAAAESRNEKSCWSTHGASDAAVAASDAGPAADLEEDYSFSSPVSNRSECGSSGVTPVVVGRETPVPLLDLRQVKSAVPPGPVFQMVCPPASVVHCG